MVNKWIYKYKSDVIVVTNGRKEENSLFVNGKLQDKKVGVFSVELRGKSSEGELIKVSIGGSFFEIKCTLSVGGVFLDTFKVDKRNVCEWTYKYGSNVITVIRQKAEELYINGKLQDNHFSIIPSTVNNLYGVLDKGEKLHVQICGSMTGLKCRTFINDKLKNLEEIDETKV